MHLSGVHVNHVQFSTQMFPNIAFLIFLVSLFTIVTNLLYSSLSVSARVVIVMRDFEKGACLLIDTEISGDRNVIKK